MLGLPIYVLGSTYYLHTRIGGKQVKRSLRTSYQRVAIIRAVSLLETLAMQKRPNLDNLPPKYELDIGGIRAKADGPEDHARLLQAIEALKAVHEGKPAPIAGTPIAPPAAPSMDDPTALKLGELVEKFFGLNKQLSQATAISYRNCCTELAKFLRNPPITRIEKSDITRYQEFLSAKGNSTRTIDNKVGNLRSVFNFAIKQGYTRNENPAADRTLLTKKQKLKSGHATFESQELAKLLHGQFFQTRREKDPDYTNVVLMALFTGCRVGEITTLRKSDFKNYKGIDFVSIRASKTMAGIRDVPLHPYLMAEMKDFIAEKTDKVFDYPEKEGKGAGNAVGKMFSRNLKAEEITRKGLVFHSIRKYLNNEMLRHKVSLEHRCQFVGHEVANVNVATYTTKISIEELAQSAFPTLNSVADLVKDAFSSMGAIDMSVLIDEETSI